MSLVAESAPEAPQVSDFTRAAHRAAFQNLSTAYSPDVWEEGWVPDFTPAAHREAFLSNAYSPPDMRDEQQRPDCPPPKERIVFQMEEVRRHTSRDDAWIVVHDNVYNITNFIKNHPGWGVGPQTSTVLAIMRTLGTDCTEEFDMIHKKYAIRQLADYRIGELQPATPGRDQDLISSTVDCAGQHQDGKSSTTSGSKSRVPTSSHGTVCNEFSWKDRNSAFGAIASSIAWSHNLMPAMRVGCIMSMSAMLLLRHLGNVTGK